MDLDQGGVLLPHRQGEVVPAVQDPLQDHGRRGLSPRHHLHDVGPPSLDLQPANGSLEGLDVVFELLLPLLGELRDLLQPAFEFDPAGAEEFFDALVDPQLELGSDPRRAV